MIAGALFALLLLLAGGGGLAMLVLPRRDCFAPELAGLSIVMGAFVTTAGWFLLSFGLSGASLRWAVAALCTALFVLGIQRFRRLEIRVRWECGWLIPLVWLVQFAVIVWQCLGQPLGADGLFIWEIKAKLAFLYGGRIPAQYFGLAWSGHHPTYPLCVPLLETWICSWLGQIHEVAAKLVFPLFFLAGANLLWTAVRRVTGSARQAAIASALLFFVPWAMFKPGGAISGWGDFPLAVGYLAALVFLLEAVGEMDPAKISELIKPMSCCLAALPWIKQEGMILAGVVIGVFFLSVPAPTGLAGGRSNWFKNFPARLLSLAALGAAPLSVVVLWQLFLTANNAAPNTDYLPVSISTFALNAHRLITIVILFTREIINWERWSLLWPLAGLALLDINRRFPRQAQVLMATLFVPGILFVGIYVFSAWPSYAAHVNTSLSRLLIPLAMPALISLGLGLSRPVAR